MNDGKLRSGRTGTCWGIGTVGADREANGALLETKSKELAQTENKSLVGRWLMLVGACLLAQIGDKVSGAYFRKDHANTRTTLSQ